MRVVVRFKLSMVDAKFSAVVMRPSRAFLVVLKDDDASDARSTDDNSPARASMAARGLYCCDCDVDDEVVVESVVDWASSVMPTR